MVRTLFGFFSGRRDIFLDGQCREHSRRLRHMLFDCGSRHEFEVSGHRCVICIVSGWRTAGFFHYRFSVDDRVIEEYHGPAWQQPPISEP